MCLRSDLPLRKLIEHTGGAGARPAATRGQQDGRGGLVGTVVKGSGFLREPRDQTRPEREGESGVLAAGGSW